MLYFVARRVGERVAHFVEQQDGERLAGAVKHDSHRAGVDRFAELFGEASREVGRRGVRMLDAVAQHGVVWFAGAAFLVYLGLHALLAALRGRPREVRSTGGDGLSARAAYRQGVISNLGNPKMAVFFTSLLPQLGDSFPSLLALGLVFCSMTFVWLTAYAFAVARAGYVLRRPAVRRAFDAVLGVVLVALGLRLATDRR